MSLYTQTAKEVVTLQLKIALKSQTDSNGSAVHKHTRISTEVNAV